jgi:hypothetical protein
MLVDYDGGAGYLYQWRNFEKVGQCSLGTVWHHYQTLMANA